MIAQTEPLLSLLSLVEGIPLPPRRAAAAIPMSTPTT